MTRGLALVFAPHSSRGICRGGRVIDDESEVSRQRSSFAASFHHRRAISNSNPFACRHLPGPPPTGWSLGRVFPREPDVAPFHCALAPIWCDNRKRTKNDRVKRHSGGLFCRTGSPCTLWKVNSPGVRPLRTLTIHDRGRGPGIQMRRYLFRDRALIDVRLWQMLRRLDRIS